MRNENGRFAKGNKVGKGRPKGSKNLNTMEIRQFYQDLVSQNLPKIQKDLDELEPRERLRYLTEITRYVIPSLKAVTGGIDDLTEEQFNEIVSRLRNEYNF